MRLHSRVLPLVLAALACAGAGALAGPRKSTPTLVTTTARQIHARASAPGARATLVNMWATWCGPCRKEFPALLRVARAHREEGLRLMLVSTDFEDQRPAVRRFLVSHGVTDTCWIKTGDDMSFINGLHPRWSGALPATLVFDAEGHLVSFWEGAADSARFESAVQTAFAATHDP